MFSRPDIYTLRARIFPAAIAVAPALALAGVIISWQTVSISSASALAVVSIVFYALADVARMRGKRVELLIYERLGGKPSTTMLRHRDGELDATTKNRFIYFLASKLNEDAPTTILEMENAPHCDAFYERCGNWLREHTRDTQKFKLLFEENVTYGFRRNLLGIKPLALWLSAGIALISICYLYSRIPISFYDSLANAFILVLIVSCLQALIFLFAVNEDAVIDAARQYARQLLLSCELLQSESTASQKAENVPTQ